MESSTTEFRFLAVGRSFLFYVTSTVLEPDKFPSKWAKILGERWSDRETGLSSPLVKVKFSLC
jgi:hypothetical protein